MLISSGFIFATILISKYAYNGESNKSLVFLAFFLMIAGFYGAKEYKKYYFNYDKPTLEFYLPKMKKPTKINISEIINLNIETNQFVLESNENSLNISLAGLSFKERQAIKDLLQLVRSDLAN